LLNLTEKTPLVRSWVYGMEFSLKVFMLDIFWKTKQKHWSGM